MSLTVQTLVDGCDIPQLLGLQTHKHLYESIQHYQTVKCSTAVHHLILGPGEGVSTGTAFHFMIIAFVNLGNGHGILVQPTLDMLFLARSNVKG